MKLVLPPQDIFEETEDFAELKASEVSLRKVLKTEMTEEGHLVWYEGLKYPKRLSVHPMAAIKVASVKRALIDGLRAISNSPITIILFVLSHKIWIDRFLHYADSVITMYSTIGIELLRSSYIKPEYLCKSGKEIYRACLKIFGEGIAKLVAQIWEFDNAYRYRFQDFFGIINIQALFENPRREILRALDEASRRENNEGTKVKYKPFRSLISIALLFPPFSQKIKEFFREIDKSKVMLDEWDFYYCCLRPDYNFGGLSYGERKVLFENENKQ